MQGPACDAACVVECRFTFVKSIERPRPTRSGKDVRIAHEPRLLCDDFEGHFWQRQRTGVALLAPFRRNRPYPILREVGPFHRNDLVAALGCEKKQLHEGAVCVSAFSGFPDRPQLVIGQDAIALPCLLLDPAHASNEGRLIGVMSPSVPGRYASKRAQNSIRDPSTMLVLDDIEQVGDVTALNFGKWAVAPDRQDMPLQHAANLVTAA